MRGRERPGPGPSAGKADPAGPRALHASQRCFSSSSGVGGRRGGPGWGHVQRGLCAAERGQRRREAGGVQHAPGGLPDAAGGLHAYGGLPAWAVPLCGTRLTFWPIFTGPRSRRLSATPSGFPAPSACICPSASFGISPSAHTSCELPVAGPALLPSPSQPSSAQGEH